MNVNNLPASGAITPLRDGGWLQLDADADAAGLGRALGEPRAAFIILIAPGTHLVEEGLNALLEHMRVEVAGVGFGAIRIPSGGVVRPPADPEEIRFRRFACGAAVVFERGLLSTVTAATGWDAAEPHRLWRLCRAACMSSLVVTTDQVIAEAKDPAPTADLARLPPDQAGEVATEIEPRIILVYGLIEASVSLYFDGLPPSLRRRLRFLRPADPVGDLPHLLAASIVIIVRGFEYFLEEGTLDLLDAMQVPYAWFIDDHLVRLAEDQPGFEYYTAARVGGFMQRCAIVLASTEALAEALGTFGGNVMTWPCVFDASLLAAAPPQGERLRTAAVVGGSFRRRALAASVLPALARIDPARRIIVHARFDLAHGLSDNRLRSVPMTNSFRQFVYRWQKLECQIVLHPAGDAANVPYKSPATLLAALYLGAVPIMADEPAYRDLGEGGFVLAGDTPKAWEAAINALAEPNRRAAAYARLETWCRQTFDPVRSFENVRRLEMVSVAATTSERDRRLRRALAHPDLAGLWSRTLPCRTLPADPPITEAQQESPPPMPPSGKGKAVRGWWRKLLQPRIARR